MKCKTLIFSLLVLPLICFSQSKNEKEIRVSKQNFPIQTFLCLNEIPNTAKRLRYYKETDNTNTSFEAKFKYKKKRYSVEFNEEGLLEDVEITINPKTIEVSILNNIKSYLNKNYKKYKLRKTQKQYVYNLETTPQLFVKSTITNTIMLKPNYEIIVEVKTDKSNMFIEFLFNRKGEFITKKRVKPASYLHVLY